MKTFISLILSFLIKTYILYCIPPNGFYYYQSLTFAIFHTMIKFTATLFCETFLATTSGKLLSEHNCSFEKKVPFTDLQPSSMVNISSCCDEEMIVQEQHKN